MSTGSGAGTRRQLILGTLSDTGRVRSNNEDRYCALLPPNTPPGVGGILAVADGVGGHESGERASQMAVNGVTKLIGRARRPLPDGSPPDGRLQQLRNAIVQINSDVYEAGPNAADARRMATTLSVAVIEGPTLSVGHVGDSRIYLFRDNSLAQLTPDHSWVAEEVARGAIRPEDASTHPRRNLLTRAVGTEPSVEPTTFSAELQNGDALLLCSDGLHGLVSDERIAAVLSSKEPDEAAKVLVDMANTAGGTDNITVLVARVLTVSPLPPSVWEDGGATTIAERRRGGGARLGAALAFPLLLPWKLLRRLGRLVKVERR